MTIPDSFDPLKWEEVSVTGLTGELKNTLTQLETDTFGNINLTGTNTTGSTITAGTFFYNNGSLVRAKTDIQDGSAITIGTNAETVTAGGLNSLNDSKVDYINTSNLTDNIITGANQTWTAPRNGWVYLEIVGGGDANGTFRLSNRIVMNVPTSENFKHMMMIPIKAGQVLASRDKANTGSYYAYFVG